MQFPIRLTEFKHSILLCLLSPLLLARYNAAHETADFPIVF
jgi:hypothetical protein